MNIKVGDMIQSNINNAVGIVVYLNDRYKETWITIKWIDTDKTSTYAHNFSFVTTFHKVS